MRQSPARLAIVFAAATLCIFGVDPGTARAEERYLEFIKALQERGYYDLAIDYVERIRKLPNVPADVLAVSDYIIGKSMLADADSLTDLQKRDEQLQRCRPFFEKFIAEHPEHESAAEASMDLSQILVERGRVAILQAENPNNQARRTEFQKAARGFFEDARKSFTAARDRFESDFKKFPPYIDEKEKKQREAKRDTQLNLMTAQLHLGLVEYEYAQTFDKNSPDYKKQLSEAIKVFEGVYARYRSWLAGLYARMWQGKCYEEMAEGESEQQAKLDLGKAEGFYKELLEHEDKESSLVALQRQVQFFQIIVFNKRGDPQLAADLAKKWRTENAALRRTQIGLGVQFEESQALIKLALAKPEKAPDRTRMLQDAIRLLQDVARYESIYKQPALVMLGKYKGLVGAGTGIVTFDQAMAAAEAAKDAKNWVEAEKLFGVAIRLAKDSIDPDQLAMIRYVRSFALNQTKRYHEAAVLGEYVARRQPKSPIAQSAGNVAMDALAKLFNEAHEKNRPADFEEARLIALAEHLIKTWPKSNEANVARFTLAELHLIHDRFDDAARAFETVGTESPDYARALGRAGDAYWKAYAAGARKPDDERDAAKLAEWLGKARETLAKGVETLRLAAKPDGPMPPELADAQMNLAEVSLESGQPADAVALTKALLPKIVAQKELAPLQLRALIALLRGQVVTDDLAGGQETMQQIERTGKDLAVITRVYLDLGKQLQSELDRIKARKDDAALKRTRDSYIKFLQQMKARREGQTFATLQWMGEAFFGLEMFAEAGDVFGQIVDRANTDAAFLDKSKPQGQAAITQVSLRLSTALRKQKLFARAWELVKPVQNATESLHKPVILNYDIIIERGLVMQEWGAENPKKLNEAISHWAFWLQRMEPLQQKPPQYFEVRVYRFRAMLDKAKRPADSAERDRLLRETEKEYVLFAKSFSQMGGATKPQFLAFQKDLEKELGRSLGDLAAPAASPATNKTTKPVGN